MRQAPGPLAAVRSYHARMAIRFLDDMRAAGTHHRPNPQDQLLSPARLVLMAACLLAVALMLAAIAGVAHGQVQKGQDFQFAESPAAPPSQFYASHGDLDTTEFVRDNAALQRVNYAR